MIREISSLSARFRENIIFGFWILLYKVPRVCQVPKCPGTLRVPKCLNAQVPKYPSGFRAPKCFKGVSVEVPFKCRLLNCLLSDPKWPYSALGVPLECPWSDLGAPSVPFSDLWVKDKLATLQEMDSIIVSQSFYKPFRIHILLILFCCFLFPWK